MLPGIVEFVTAPVTILLGASFLKREVQIFGGVLSGYGHGHPYFSAHDRGHDRPEHHHHTRDAHGESGLGRSPTGEAEARQR
jgi:ABC-type nickel/cobalt efflux system permease component RcnA